MIPGGLREDTSKLAGDGFLTLQNVTRWKTDTLQERAGLSNRIDQGGRAMTTFADSSGNTWVFTVRSGTIWRASTTYGSSGTKVVSGVDTGAIGCFVQADERLYYADGTDVWYIDRDLAVGTAGIDAPPTASGYVGSYYHDVISGGDMSEGLYSYRYRYYDSDTGYLSDPSEISATNLYPGDPYYLSQIAFDYAADSHTGAYTLLGSAQTGTVDKVIMEMTAGDGTEFYDVLVIDNPTSSGTTSYVNKTNMEIRAGLRRAGGATVGNSPPPNAPIVCEHRSRLFGIGVSGTENLLYWSGAGKPEGWNTVNQARSVFQNSGDDPSALLSAFGDLYILGQTTIARLAYNSDPGTGYLETLPTSLGAWNHRCVVWVENQVYGAGPGGLWKLTSMVPKSVSNGVRETLQTGVNRSKPNQFFLVHDPVDRVILYFYPSSGSSTADSCLVYDYVNEEWRSYDYDHAITAGCTGLDDNAQARAWLCTDSYSYYMEHDVQDGVKSGEPEVVTINSVSGTTVFNVAESFSGSDTVKGAYCYDPTTSGTRQITTNAANQITISSGFTTTPSSGTSLYLGTVDVDIAPKWLRDEKSRSKMRPSAFCITFDPDSSTGTENLRLEFYKDLDTSPLTFTKDAYDDFPNGWTVTDEQNYVELDFALDDGYIAGPFTSDWGRYWRWRIHGRRPVDLSLLEVDIQVDAHDAAVVRNE